MERGVSQASGATIGRWLAEDAIEPWQQTSSIFPRDPDFLAKAGARLNQRANDQPLDHDRTYGQPHFGG